MMWSRDYIDLAELYSEDSSFQEKRACVDALRISLPADIKNLNTGWMSAKLPYGYKSAWEIMRLVRDSSSLSEFWLKSNIRGMSFSKPELSYLVILLLVYRFKWLYEWQASDEKAMDTAAGFALSDFLDEEAMHDDEA